MPDCCPTQSVETEVKLMCKIGKMTKGDLLKIRERLVEIQTDVYGIGGIASLIENVKEGEEEGIEFFSVGRSLHKQANEIAQAIDEVEDLIFEPVLGPDWFGILHHELVAVDPE